jgi:ubiquitin fusion degradation protein 1
VCELPPACTQQTLAVEQAAQAAEQQRLADETALRLAIQAEKAALVAAEVDAGSAEPHAALLFRLPDGSRLSRRFKLAQQVNELFYFLDSGGAGGLWPGTYKLVLQFPRRVLTTAADGGSSLQEAGFEAGSQQAVFVEHDEQQ